MGIMLCKTLPSVALMSLVHHMPPSLTVSSGIVVSVSAYHDPLSNVLLPTHSSINEFEFPLYIASASLSTIR